MRVLAGGILLAAVIGFGVYKAFIDPTYVVNVDLSINLTEACVDEHPDLNVNGELTDQVNDRAEPPALVVQRGADEAVVVFFFSSESAAANTRDEVAEGLATGLGDEFANAVTQRGSLIVAHPGVASGDLSSTYGPCLVEVSDSRWGSWMGFDNKTIDLPFRQG